jgi:hypothetical protein
MRVKILFICLSFVLIIENIICINDMLAKNEMIEKIEKIKIERLVNDKKIGEDYVYYENYKQKCFTIVYSLIDPRGNIFICDLNNNRLIKYLYNEKKSIVITDFTKFNTRLKVNPIIDYFENILYLKTNDGIYCLNTQTNLGKLENNFDEIYFDKGNATIYKQKGYRFKHEIKYLKSGQKKLEKVKGDVTFTAEKKGKKIEINNSMSNNLIRYSGRKGFNLFEKSLLLNDELFFISLGGPQRKIKDKGCEIVKQNIKSNVIKKEEMPNSLLLLIGSNDKYIFFYEKIPNNNTVANIIAFDMNLNEQYRITVTNKIIFTECNQNTAIGKYRCIAGIGEDGNLYVGSEFDKDYIVIDKYILKK